VIKHTIARSLISSIAAAGILYAGAVSAIDWNITGFFRQEIAYSLHDDGNPNNIMGNPFNSRIVPQITSAAFMNDATMQNGLNANARAATTVFNSRADNLPGGILRGGLFASAELGKDAFTLNANGSHNLIRDRLPAGSFTSSPVSCMFGHSGGRDVTNGRNRGILGLPSPNPGVVDVPFTLMMCPNGQGSTQGNAGLAQIRGLTLNNGAIVRGPTPGIGLPNTGTDFSASHAGQSAGEAVSLAGQALNDEIDFNLFNSRVEVDIQGQINPDLAMFMKVRAYFDGTRNFVDGGTEGGIDDHYANPFFGNRRATLTEWNSPDAIIDIPFLYFDWAKGPLWIRFGNQVIAWGEAYFFRTMDVANGLDLRRHLVLGPGAEEYQDQRVASPAIRLSYTFKNGWEVDAFVQMFSPSILPGQNTPYNVAPTSIYMDQSDGWDDAEGALNFGFKLTMPITDAFTAMVAYANRRNPDGYYTGADAPTVHRGINNPFCLNQNNATNNVLALIGNPHLGLGMEAMPTLDTNQRTMRRGCGTSFAPDDFTSSSLEYWYRIRTGRIDSSNYVSTQVDEFPASRWATREIFGFGNEGNFADTFRTLEGFRSSFGNITQYVGRYYRRERNYMIGGNYIVTTDSAESIFDQLIIRGEVNYTPNKALTNDLSFNFSEQDDIVSSFILEKYHRFSYAFPATYMVFQWMHRTATDMFGRDLDKNNTRGISDFIDSTTGAFTQCAFDNACDNPQGSSSANYVVFAFQQPFPNLIWRADFAIMVDVAGGYLIQPGIRYRPSAKYQWDLYATMINTYSADNDTVTESLDWADEIFVRFTYFF